MKGQIIRLIGGFYDVNSNETIYRVKASGKMRHEKRSPIVGDFVEFEEDKFITKIYDQKNVLIRPKVANVDQAAIVVSLVEPKYSALLLTKFLAVIEKQNIKPIIIFTKKDISDFSVYQEYKDQGYEAFEISNKDFKGQEFLSSLFENKITVFTGQTGVGKSSTISNIADVERETQEISKALGRGKHTTRVVEMVKWAGGWLVDTPGFSSFDVHLTPKELASSFQDFKKNRKQCKFRDCLHEAETKCAIKLLVQENKISINRYNSYLKILQEVKND